MSPNPNAGTRLGRWAIRYGAKLTSISRSPGKVMPGVRLEDVRIEVRSPFSGPLPAPRHPGGTLEVPDRRDIGAVLPEATSRRMPRLQVYLPDELYRAVKERQLPASELLQGAVRAELRRQELLEETDRYLTELVGEVGEPSPAAVARAERLAQRVRGEKAGASKAS